MLSLIVLFSGCIDAPGDGVKVITVGAANFQGQVSDFSGSGPLRDGRVKPDILAPGEDVVSTVPLGLGEVNYVGTFYAKESGTSLSTPVAAGVAALLLQKDPTTTPAGIKAALIRGAMKLNNSLGESYEPFYQGAGLVDANQSSHFLSPDVCAVLPDKWVVGRWVFSEDSAYPGIDVGADRDQKKIYAMAPGNDEWTTRFLFMTNCQRSNLSFQTSGDVAGWIEGLSLPGSMAANSQAIFGATIVVPNETAAGIYSGSIEILEGAHKIISVPVIVQVPQCLDVQKGSALANGEIKKGQWCYYCLDVPAGTRNLTAQLNWSGSSNLDLLLLDPSGNSYVDEKPKSKKSEEVSLVDPISGRYIVAIHARSITSIQNYSLRVEESVISVRPSSLDFGSLEPDQSKTLELKLMNGGLMLNDLTFTAKMESKITDILHGEVARDDTWEKSIVVDDNISRLALSIVWKGKDVDLDLDAYDPSDDLAGWSYGADGSSEVLEINRPFSGLWKLSVYGDEVPRDTSQPFDVYVTTYGQDDKPSVNVSGPSQVASGTVGSIAVTVTSPSQAEGQEKRGYIELNSSNYSISVPVSYTVVGASIKGIAGVSFNDSDRDGHIDILTVGVRVASGVPGLYEVRGPLYDCSGRMIRWVSNSSIVAGEGVINLDVDGREIWLKSGCGPLRFGSLLLYNAQGDLVGKYNANELIEKEPREFQAPDAYFNGSFENLSETRRGAVSMIAVGVGIHAMKEGKYLVSASLQSESGIEVASFDRTVHLSSGNNSVVVEFNARKFGIDDGVKLFLRDLVITREDETIDEMKEAWSSGEMDFGG
jgi:subtilisin family serine protease